MRVQYAMAGETGNHGLGEAVKEYWPMITGAAIAAWAVIGKLFSEKRLSEKSRAELETIAQDAIKGTVTILTNENARLASRVEELQVELDEAKSGFAASLLSKDGEISMLRGTVRGILATALSYQAKLEAAGLPHEKVSPHYWDVSGFQVREVEVMTDDR